MGENTMIYENKCRFKSLNGENFGKSVKKL